MNQQVDCTIILKLTIYTIISGRKPWITIQQRTDCSVLKTDNEQCGGNEMVRRQITEALREAILHYDLNDPAKNDAYLRENYPDDSE